MIDRIVSELSQQRERRPVEFYIREQYLPIVQRIKKLHAIFVDNTYTVTHVGPAVWTDNLFPPHDDEYDKLRPLERIWQLLTPQAQALFMHDAVPEASHRAVFDEKKALKALIGLFTPGGIDLSFQELHDSEATSLKTYWKPLFDLMSDITNSVLDVPLSIVAHAPYFVNNNVDSETMERIEHPYHFNLSFAFLTGHIPRKEQEKYKGNLEEEKARRANIAQESIARQIQWLQQVYAEQHLEQPIPLTIHLNSVGDFTLTDEELKNGIKCLQELQNSVTEVTLAVETQGLTIQQLEYVIKQNIPLVFDIAHTAIESDHYGYSVLQNLEKYKEHITLIHFTQPLIKDEHLHDQHNGPASEGFFTTEQQLEILQFATMHKIPVTFESSFLFDDVFYLHAQRAVKKD